VTTHITKS